MVAHCRLHSTNESFAAGTAPLTELQFKKLVDEQLPLYIQLIDIAATPNVVRVFRDAELTDEIRVVDEDSMSSCKSTSLDEMNADSSELSFEDGGTDEPEVPTTVVVADSTNGVESQEATPEPVEVFLSWALSSDDFYLQHKCRSEEGERMTQRLTSAPAFGVMNDPHVGDLCAARFVDDDAFYRARVLAVDPLTKGEFLFTKKRLQTSSNQ